MNCRRSLKREPDRGARGAAIRCFTETGTGLAWDKDGMTPHAAIVEKGRNRWKTPDANPRLN